jgi:hypothetical protein
MPTKSTAKLNAPKASSSATCYASLAEKAWEHGRKKALKFNDGFGYDKRWNEAPEASRVGFVAMTEFIAETLKRNNAQAEARGTAASANQKPL